MILTSDCEPEPGTEASVAETELFQVVLRSSACGERLVLAGEIGLDAVHRLSDAALQAVASGREVSLDWSDAQRVCAGALQILLALGTALSARGLALSVAGDNPGVRRVLELASLSQLFPVQPGVL